MILSCGTNRHSTATLHSQATAYIPGNWFIHRPSVSFVSVAGSPAVVSRHMKYFCKLCGSVEQSVLTRHVGGGRWLLVKLSSWILFLDVFTHCGRTHACLGLLWNVVGWHSYASFPGTHSITGTVIRIIIIVIIIVSGIIIGMQSSRLWHHGHGISTISLWYQPMIQ